MKSSFKEGDHVFLHSLKNWTLNGEHGTLLAFSKENMRWGLELDMGKFMLVKPENLRAETAEERNERINEIHIKKKIERAFQILNKWEKKPHDKVKRKAAFKLIDQEDILTLVHKTGFVEDVKTLLSLCSFTLKHIDPNIPREYKAILKIVTHLSSYAVIAQDSALMVMKSGALEHFYSLCMKYPPLFQELNLLIEMFTMVLMQWPKLKNRVKETPGFDIVDTKVNLNSEMVKIFQKDSEIEIAKTNEVSIAELRRSAALLECDHCNKSETRVGEFLKCGRCRMVVYCSKDCQRKSWNDGHKKECKKRKKL